MAAVRFLGQLRLRGRIPRGSDLHSAKNLRKLLTFPTPPWPDVGIVLVDEDGSKSRFALAEQLTDLLTPNVVGVAVPEFAAWQLSDLACLQRVLGVNPTSGQAVPPVPEPS